MGRSSTTFQKGHKGYGGRPKGVTFRGIFRAYLEQCDSNLDPRSRFQLAAEMLWNRAKKDTGFLLESMKFLEGPSPKDSEVDGQDTKDAFEAFTKFVTALQAGSVKGDGSVSGSEDS